MVIHALTVGRNEESRYLERFLDWSSTFVDSHFFYDDQSDDATVEIAAKYCVTAVRPTDSSSFLDNEGIFRENAYREFEGACKPKSSDWVLALDCDEFLVGVPNERRALEQVIVAAEASRCDAVYLPIPEVFSLEDGVQVRTDGWWGSIGASRLFKFRPGGKFHHRKMGGGSTPTGLTPYSDHDPSIHLLHFGYAELVDKHARRERYGTKDSGHNPKHIRSILETPTLERWSSPLPSWLNQSA